MVTFPNRLWLLAQRPEARRFERACARPRAAAEAVLQGYLDRSAPRGLATVADFRRQMQATTWDETEICTRERIERHEETSGSTGFVKRVPCTRRLRREFERAVAPWMCALHRTDPAAFAGRAYWSLSPPVKPGAGMESDTDYFGPLAAWLLRRILAVPPTLARSGDAEAFWRATVEHLLAARDLSFVSVWSPTFFLQLDARLGRPETWSETFPRLRVLSCWADAHSALYLPRVRERLGDVRIQAKGLLATEGVTSIPMPGGDPVLAVRSHYHEFLGESGDLLACDEVRVGSAYEVVLTTGGGLCRYRTGDLVEVTGHYRSAPRLRFLGRLGRQSDLVGEKLSEHHVSAALSRVLAGAAVSLAFVYPDDRPGYSLCVEGRVDVSPRAVEAELERNPYYAQARALGQLGALRTRRLPDGFRRRLIDHLGVKEGDFKPHVLYGRGTLDPLLG